MINKKVLVIGAFGFMGKNVVNILKNSQNQIFQESRKTGLDLFSIQSVEDKISAIKPDIIINCAAHVGSMPYVAKYPANVFHDNTLMYLNLYQAINNVDKNILVINPISNCSYPGIIDIQHEENWWDGKVHQSVESYGVPKKIGFILSECYKKQFGIKTINLIIPNSYGPNDYLDEDRTHAMNGIIIRMLKAKNNNDKNFVVWGSGTPIREWIYMPDVAKIIKIIIDENILDLPNPINLGQQEGISILETVNLVKEKLNFTGTIELDLSKQDGAPVKVLGNKLFNKYFADFIFTSYNNGIGETIKYYKELI